MSVAGITAGSPPAREVKKPMNEFGRDAFLQLLVTQLRYQDPLNPLSNEDFIAQTAQFTSLETLEKINKNVEASNQTFGLMGGMLATSMIGKEITANVNQLSLKGEDASSIEIDIPDNYDVFVNIYDKFGARIRKERINGESGNYSYKWDGYDDGGDMQKDGIYSLSVQAINSRGESISLSPLAVGHVTKAKFMGGGGTVMLGDLTVPVSQVIEIRDNAN